MKDSPRGMTIIVKTVTRFTVGIIIIYGIFTVLKGHSSPGGGFAGGVIIALAFINLILAFGRGEVAEKVSEAKGLIFSTVGITVFFILSVFSFLGLHSRRARLSAFCDIALALMVSAGLYLMFLVLITLVSKREKR